MLALVELNPRNYTYVHVSESLGWKEVRTYVVEDDWQEGAERHSDNKNTDVGHKEDDGRRSCDDVPEDRP